MKYKIAYLAFCTIFLISCSKYTASNNSSNTTSNSQTAYTPIGAGSSTTSSGGGGSTSSGGGSTTTTDSADGVYVQGIYLDSFYTALSYKNVATGNTAGLYTQGYYTKLATGAYSFYAPVANQSSSKYLGQTHFTTNGYYTVMATRINHSLVVLDNGLTVNPSTSKAYVRFINICDTSSNVSINVKISTSNDEAYFSYRKPFDFYAVGNEGIWTSIYNQMYNSAYTNYTSVNPGTYKGEIYTSNNVTFNTTPTFTFSGGKKYTIIVGQKSLTQTTNNYYFTYIQHN